MNNMKNSLSRGLGFKAPEIRSHPPKQLKPRQIYEEEEGGKVSELVSGWGGQTSLDVVFL